MTLHVKQSGVWKPVNNLYVKNAGVWKVAQLFVKQAGVWKPVSTGGVTLNTATIATTNYVGTHSIVVNSLNFNTDGSVTYGGSDYSGPTAWATPVAAGRGTPYSMRYHESFKQSNITYVGNITKDTWVALTANRQVSYQNNGTSVSGAASGTVELSSNGGSTTAATFTISFGVGYQAF